MTVSGRVTPHPKSAVGFMVVLGGIIVGCVLLYYAFWAVDGWGLAELTGEAIVRGKNYREAGTTYQTQKVGDRMLTVPQTTPGMYVLELDLDGVATEAAVSKPTYDAVNEGDRVTVAYQRRRITGKLQMINVTQ